MMADVIVDTMHNPLDVVTEKVYEDADTQQTAKENMTEKPGATTVEGADAESTTMGKEVQPDVAALEEDDASPGVRVESADHAKDGVEHDADGAHETSKGQPDAEAAESEESTSKENMLEAVTEKVGVPAQSTETEDTERLDTKVDGEANASPGVHVEDKEHAKDDVDHAQDSAHDNSKGQSSEVPDPEDSLPKGNMFEALSGKGATAAGTDPEDASTKEEQHLGTTMNGKDDTTPETHVEATEHTKDVIELAEDGALREEQQVLQGQDKSDPTTKEPSLDDSNPYGLDTSPEGVEEGVPIGEVSISLRSTLSSFVPLVKLSQACDFD